MYVKMEDATKLLVARGECSKGQENTTLALDAALNDNTVYGAEISVLTTNFGDCVLSHDQDIFDLIGKHTDIRTLTKEQIEKLDIQKQVKGRTYPNTAKFMFLEPCFQRYVASLAEKKDNDKPKDMALWLSVKNPGYKPWSCGDNTPSILTDALLKLSKSYDMSKIYISSTNPFIVSAMIPLAKGKLNIFYDIGTWGCCNCLEWLLIRKVLSDGSFTFCALDAPFSDAATVKRFHDKKIKVINYGIGDKPRVGIDDYLLIDK